MRNHPQHLLDACVSDYVGAWMCARKIKKHGNTWAAAGAYHSGRPTLRDAYARRIHDIVYAALRACMHEQFWSSVPPLKLAVEACHRLHDAGYDLVCVSALARQFEGARLRNLRDAGFPIERVIATGRSAVERSPKAEAIEQLAPLVFVDDFLPYFRGVTPSVHRALICRGLNGTPNVGPELEEVHSSHGDLWKFSEWMLDPGRSMPSRAA